MPWVGRGDIQRRVRRRRRQPRRVRQRLLPLLLYNRRRRHDDWRGDRGPGGSRQRSAAENVRRLHTRCNGGGASCLGHRRGQGRRHRHVDVRRGQATRTREHRVRKTDIHCVTCRKQTRRCWFFLVFFRCYCFSKKELRACALRKKKESTHVFSPFFSVFF